MNKEEIEEKLEKLERNKIAYLEVEDSKNVKRIEKQIEQLEEKLELFKLNKIKQELNVYKEVVKEYPEVRNKISLKLERSK